MYFKNIITCILNIIYVKEECQKTFEDVMTKCDEREHITYSSRVVERWRKRGEWCTAFSTSGEEAADVTNNFCESAFR